MSDIENKGKKMGAEMGDAVERAVSGAAEKAGQAADKVAGKAQEIKDTAAEKVQDIRDTGVRLYGTTRDAGEHHVEQICSSVRARPLCWIAGAGLAGFLVGITLSRR